MKIYCKQQKPLEVSQMVNRVGKYIYNHIDDAYEWNTSSNTCDVYMHIMYQDLTKRAAGKIPGRGYDDVDIMSVNISITTYANKIRVNTIEMNPQERTLGYDLIDPLAVRGDIVALSQVILDKVVRRVERTHKDYIILW